MQKPIGFSPKKNDSKLGLWLTDLPQIDVCIATYKRPSLLRKLIKSLLVQETAQKFTISINIADNDEMESGRTVIEEFAGSSIPIKYTVQSKKNISLTRNASMALSSGEYIAILDDDQYAKQDWLLRYFDCMQSLNADVLHGPNEYYFEQTPTMLVRDCKEFSRFKFETGATTGYCRRSGNCFIRRSLIEESKTHFDEAYGTTGGEDSDFFERVAMHSDRFAWCEEAVTYEYVPHTRASMRWLLRRLFIHGNNNAIRSRIRLDSSGFDSRTSAMRKQVCRHIAGVVKNVLRCKWVGAFDEALFLAFALGYLFHSYTEKSIEAY